MEQAGQPTEPPPPILHPPARGSNWRTTALLAAVLGGLVLLRVATTHPAPTPSHVTPQGAVAGYLAALKSADLPQVEAYLAPSQRAQAETMLGDLRRDHVLLVSPVVEGVVGQGDQVSVEATVEVCYRASASEHYRCQLLVKQPLGLADSFQCSYLGGRWYVTTLLEPLPLSGS